MLTGLKKTTRGKIRLGGVRGGKEESKGASAGFRIKEKGNEKLMVPEKME